MLCKAFSYEKLTGKVFVSGWYKKKLKLMKKTSIYIWPYSFINSKIWSQMYGKQKIIFSTTLFDKKILFSNIFRIEILYLYRSSKISSFMSDKSCLHFFLMYYQENKSTTYCQILWNILKLEKIYGIRYVVSA